MKTLGRSVLFVGIVVLAAFVVMAQAGSPLISSAAGPSPTEPTSTEPTPTEPTPSETPEPADNHLPFIAKQPTLTPTPTNTPTNTPTPTNTATPQPTVIVSAQYCRGPFKIISPAGTPTVVDTMTISNSGTIVDMEAYINTTHTFVGDLRFTLTHGAVSRILIDRPGVPATTFGCAGDDISTTLDDSAALAVENQCLSTAPTISGTFFPNQSLSSFNNQNVNGSWTMTVQDFVSGDGGEFNGWCLFVDYTITP